MNALTTIKTASEMLGVSEQTLRDWDNAGKLKAYRTLGNHRRYRMEDIENLLIDHKCWQPRIVISYDNLGLLPQEILVHGIISEPAQRVPDSGVSTPQSYYFRKTKQVDPIGPFDIRILFKGPPNNGVGVVRQFTGECHLQTLEEDKAGNYTLWIDSLYPKEPYSSYALLNKPENYSKRSVWSKAPISFYGEEFLFIGNDTWELRLWLYERSSKYQ